MTMRNAVPRFGMRVALTLAVLAVVALAALLAVRSPASAQSLTGTEIWSETLTAGVRTVINEDIYRGYWQTDIFNLGSLTGGDLYTGRRGYPIHILSESIFTDITLSTAGRRLWFGPGIRNRSSLQLNQNELKSMTLHVEGQSFAFEDATESEDGDVGYVYAWPLSSSFGWAEGATVAVSITAVPVIFIEAVSTTVEYGGNDNYAESIAEFRFTRYGSAENELSFRVTNRGIFTPGKETVTLKFTAGQSSFSNFHWAVDVDISGDPVCLIVWNVRSGNDFLEGTPSEARVVVAGPGTTCQGGM